MNNKIIAILCSLILAINGFSFAKASESQNDPYVVGSLKNTVFVNEKGEEIFKLDKNKYDFSGEFSEGKVFVAKIIEEQNLDDLNSYIVRFTLLDNLGNVVKELPYDAILVRYKNNDMIIPEYRNSKAVLDLKDGSSVILNEKGEKIKASAIDLEEEDVNASVNDGFYHNTIYPIDKNAPKPFKYGKNDKYVGYKDIKGKIIKLNTCNPPSEGDMTEDVHFYNGIALVFDKNYKKRFIDTKGKYINNETYDMATPFWRKLAYVVSGKKYGLINAKGEWVWFSFYE